MYKYTVLNVDMYIAILQYNYIMIFDISIQPKCVSIQYHCFMYHDMATY